MSRIRIFLFFTLFALPGWSQVTSEVRLTSDSFISPSYNTAGSSATYQFLGANFETDPKSKDDFRIALRAAYAIGAPMLSYINPKEFSYRFQISDDQTFTVGRQRQNWNELDRRWSFGVIEPVFKWNPLSPEGQGLTGLFWDVKNEYFRLNLFGSFLYIPDQGASFDINQNGEFVRGNPWFRRPPDSLRVFSQVSKIEYGFERPSEASIVLQPSYGARLDFGEETPWRLRTALFYKPMNQLALGYDGQLDIARDRGVVEIQPEVVYHGVTAVDAYYQAKRFRVGVSGIHDKPSDEQVFDARWTAPVFSAATLISPFADVLIAKGWKVSAQYLTIKGGEVSEKGALASPGRASISTRYPYQEAGQISLEMDRSLLRSKRLAMKGSYTQSNKNDFTLVRLQARLELSSLWSVQSELQLVEAGDLTSNNRNEIAEFRNNDRLLVGLGYVF